MPTAAEARALLRQFLREGRKFPNYNIREYVRRKALALAQNNKNGSAPAEVWRRSLKDLELVKRQAIVYSLYARKQRSVMDLPLVKVLEQQAGTS